MTGLLAVLPASGGNYTARERSKNGRMDSAGNRRGAFFHRGKKPYSSDYDECLERAANEKAENARPELVNRVENMEDYDTIFIGYQTGGTVVRWLS